MLWAAVIGAAWYEQGQVLVVFGQNQGCCFIIKHREGGERHYRFITSLILKWVLVVVHSESFTVVSFPSCFSCSVLWPHMGVTTCSSKALGSELAVGQARMVGSHLAAAVQQASPGVLTWWLQRSQRSRKPMVLKGSWNFWCRSSRVRACHRVLQSQTHWLHFTGKSWTSTPQRGGIQGWEGLGAHTAV